MKNSRNGSKNIWNICWKIPCATISFQLNPVFTNIHIYKMFICMYIKSYHCIAEFKRLTVLNVSIYQSILQLCYSLRYATSAVKGVGFFQDLKGERAVENLQIKKCCL